MSKGFILWPVGYHQKVVSRRLMKLDLGLREVVWQLRGTRLEWRA